MGVGARVGNKIQRGKYGGKERRRKTREASWSDLNTEF